MKWIACVVLVAACQSGSGGREEPATERGTQVIQLPKAEVTEQYRADITNLCDCLHLSGADQAPKDEQWQVIAMWLGPHITTTAGHDFLIAIQPLQGEAKALALESEAKRVGVAKCELANVWRQQG
jgi:hypothetical protein